MIDDQAETVRRAVALATAWSHEDPNVRMRDVLILLESFADDDPEHRVLAMTGLQNLVQILLFRLECATNRTRSDILQEIGRDVA